MSFDVWHLAHGVCCMTSCMLTYGARRVKNSIWCTAYDVRCKMYDVWCRTHVVWYMAYGYMVYDFAYDAWCVVHGERSMVSKLRLRRTSTSSHTIPYHISSTIFIFSPFRPYQPTRAAESTRQQSRNCLAETAVLRNRAVQRTISETSIASSISASFFHCQWICSNSCEHKFNGSNSVKHPVCVVKY